MARKKKAKKKLLSVVSVKEKSNSVLSWSACDDEGYDMAAELGPCLTGAAVMDSKGCYERDRQNECC